MTTVFTDDPALVAGCVDCLELAAEDLVQAIGITSNLVFSQWDQIFQNPMATAAAIDRVVHHSVILEFDVPSCGRMPL